MTAITGDMISALVGPPLGVENRRSLRNVLAADPPIESERRIASGGS